MAKALQEAAVRSIESFQTFGLNNGTGMQSGQA
jgi:hypothetical protein